MTKKAITIEESEIEEIKTIINDLRNGGELPIKTISKKWRELIAGNLELGIQNYYDNL